MTLAVPANALLTEPPATLALLPEILTLYDFGYDETEVDLGEPSGLTLTQQTEYGDTMSVILSRGMLEELWPYLNLWMKQKP